MKKSVKARWAIGLLIFQMASTAISILANYPFAYFISLIFECIPTIGAIVLIFYDHSYKAPIVGKFTLLRAWTLGLIWVQPVLSLISWGASGMLDAYIVGFWIGSCIFIIIATVLLVQDGQTFVKARNQDSEHKVGFAESTENMIKETQNKIENGETAEEPRNKENFEEELTEDEIKTQERNIFAIKVVSVIVVLAIAITSILISVL